VNANIQSLRDQHVAIEELAATIVDMVASFRDEFDAIAMARLIGKLNALLRVHLAYEDTVLYPFIVAHGSREAAALAQQFSAETSSLAPQFEEFARAWSGPTVISAMFERFRDEATTLFAALGARIERENDLLFPLLHQLAHSHAA
jgi:iron-sulfur cluster repair protein YtfE (RIC family)